MSHTVTVKFDELGCRPSYSLTCTQPASLTEGQREALKTAEAGLSTYDLTDRAERLRAAADAKRAEVEEQA